MDLEDMLATVPETAKNADFFRDFPMMDPVDNDNIDTNPRSTRRPAKRLSVMDFPGTD